MGLDIYLIKIVPEPKSKYDWLTDKENPELRAYFSKFLSTRKIELENGEVEFEIGYHTLDIAYQRKGVTSKFFKLFKTDDFIFSFDQLLKLRDCIDKEHLKSFEENFMQKFKENENFILLCY
ncbi:hypothetical protein [Tenacibaculum sp. 190524A05c]|uniref:hypothetical protein n=1 Tax=Tenacibaculum platacis TaxID=3137852 RepID=UPI0032B1E5BA